MLVNLNKDRKKEKAWKRWDRKCRRLYPNLNGGPWETIVGFDRFIPYAPRGDEYTTDSQPNFRGVFVMREGYGNCFPFRDISNCTRSHSSGENVMYGVCDNASQVIELYNAIFNGAEYSGDQENLNLYLRLKKSDEEAMAKTPDGKYSQKYGKFWRGNHVIILTPVTKNNWGFRWHKWGPYIGNFNHTHEYFCEEDGIDMVYTFSVFKVT